MSDEGDAAPMEEDAVQLCAGSPSADSASSMDWVKVDDKAQPEEPSADVAMPPKNFDEYSFGSSDDDGDAEDEDGLEKIGDVSLADTSFDMGILQRSIEGSKEALELVVGREVVLVVGKTGVGKSTLIQGIAGKQIHSSVHRSSFSGQTATKAVFEAKDALPNFEIGHAKASKTRTLNAFLRGSGDNEVVYLDSPGLEDTRGVEMDIATSALLSQVAKRAKNLRFAVLIHCASLLEDRGNAFRSLVHFAHKFVGDFEASKRSFMFLFTHTDEITGMESSTDAKNRLQQEIIQIAGATKDGDVLAVLEFVRKSLKKDYPFADALHPLDSDYSKLTGSIETALVGVRPKPSARSCNLILSSRLKLEAALQNLLERLQLDPNNVSQVKDIQTSFRYLQEFVDVDCVHRAASQCEDFVDDHKRGLARCIEEEFARWGSPTADFEESNARALSDALMLLAGFDSSFSAQHWIECKKDAVTQLQDLILANASSCKSFVREFKKLQTWATAFDFYSENYAGTCKQIMALYETAVDFLSRTDLPELHRGSDVAALMDKVLVLNGMCSFGEQASVLEINLEQATGSQEKILQDFATVFGSWTAKASNLSESQTMTFEDDLNDIAMQARVLQSMASILVERGINIGTLDKSIQAALSSLEGDVVSLFTLCCDSLMNSPFDRTWEPKIRWMHKGCQQFAGVQGGRWRDLDSSLSAVIHRAKAALHSTSGELDNMAHMTKEHGMRSGEKLGNELVQFQKCKWFDAYLPQGDAFVANCCIAIDRAFQTRVDRMSTELAESISSLGKETPGSVESIEKLKVLLPELREIDDFLQSVGASIANPPSLMEDDAGELSSMEDTQSMLASQCVHQLEEFARTLSEHARERTSQWFSDVDARNLESLRSSAPILDLIFADAQALNEFQAIKAVAQKSKKIIRGISNGCSKLSSLADAELKQFGGDFRLKADLLTLIESCDELPQIRQLLPNYKDAQHQVRTLVAHAAQTLESEIETTSEWDDIDRRIETFKSAVALDPFVSQEASARLSTLQRLREKKEGQVDEHLQTMIRANNFKGLAEFLSPLANSKDQIKKQKYESFREDVALNLNLIIQDTKRCLNQNSMADEDTVRSVAQNMSVLVDAKSNLERLLRGKPNVGSQIGQLRTKIDGVLKPTLDIVSESVSKKDFVRAVLAHNQASLFMQHLENYLKPPSKKRCQRANGEYKRALKMVPGYVVGFFESQFKDRNDLLKALTSLKQAKENGDPLMTPLASLYDETTESLLTRARDFVATVQDSVSQAQCFDDVMPLLHSLSRQLNGPFRAHVPNNLLMECENLLDRLHTEKQAYDRKFEFGGEDEDPESHLDLWREELDRLESPKWYRLWKADADRASYKSMKKRIMARVDDVFKQANDSLRTRDFRSVQDSIDYLSLVEKKLAKHVDHIRVRLQRLQEQCVNSFLSLCGHIKATLQKDELLRVEEKFADYRGFLVFIPCILASKECKREFKLVNQMMYESFAKEIDSLLAMENAETFDFACMRATVVRVRKLGDFFADRLTLLNEEVKQHITSDKWLDEIQQLCSKHFSNGRDFGKLKYCIDLGVIPSASKKEISKAYKMKAKLCHPDKNRRGSKEAAAASFRKIKEAQDELLSSDHFNISGNPRAFDEILKSIGSRLRALAKHFMEDQRYSAAEQLLFQLPALKEVESLVTPKLKSTEIKSSVREIIRGHVEKMRVEVDSAWSERRYKDLHQSISDLKQMESHFKSYPDIFAKSWNTGICEAIESEIDALGKKAMACLSSHSAAKKNEADFRRFFIDMGSVLVELPSFKAHTKHVMSNILENCLESAWGYGFLFEFGLGLQKGDDSIDADERRIAQMVVSEFSHFKEVLTMCWNEETSQKPAEDVVKHIKGEQRSTAMATNPIHIDQKELIEAFKSYEKQYKAFLGEYVKPDADLNALVQKISGVAEQLRPFSCDDSWTMEEKKSIPLLLAGIFSLFTVVKSGASFNRIEAAGGSTSIGEKLLMKPHNIQVLTLLHMFGCGKGDGSSLDSQLMQIRTGEGKSMILGCAAAMFALLGFRVRTVCYSEYLSSRDFRLFEEVFRRFGILDDVKYSKITTFAEDSTALKGNIRDLTESLLRGSLLPTDLDSLAIDGKRDSKKKQKTMPAQKKQKTMPALKSRKGSSSDTALAKKGSTPVVKGQTATAKEEILLVDEVDVFFGSEFYGQTYNQVLELQEPEIATILKRIWSAHSRGGRLRLRDVQAMPEYKTLLAKLASFAFLIDNEISLMLAQVKRVDDIPYYLDSETDRIGYKVMDSISYNVTLGYSTIFAYLKEEANLKDKASALARALAMPVSCGQFSYANIDPARILGVSGTLEAIGQYEKDVLNSYGLNTFVYIPSVYGESNFFFDKAGEGIYFEPDKSNFYQKLAAEIANATKSKRAVIVFFKDRLQLNAFVSSPTYRKLGRHKTLLTEDMSSAAKEHAISAAATAGKITLSTAVFGRGTDFFCKDEVVEKNGGVHIIQTFLSEHVSEEVQIQGRTARQGKKGSYQMILLDSELASDFSVSPGEREKVPKKDWYDWLCNVRLKHHQEQCLEVEKNVEDAIVKDTMTHDYFDSLLARNETKSKEKFKNLYQLIKKPPVPSLVSIDLALVVDVTGSMAPYAQSAVSTITNLISGQNALLSKLASNFPEIEFELRLACLAFRDIDDGGQQYTELKCNNGSHFSANAPHVLNFMKTVCAAPSGGFDLAEDIIGALHRCASWQDWESDIKFAMLLTDAAAHGLSPTSSSRTNNADSYSARHPNGLTAQHAVASMVSQDADLFFLSFNPSATERTENELSKQFEVHPDNAGEHGVTRIPMVPQDAIVTESSAAGRHIIFVLDESGSMQHSWSGVVAAYNQYNAKRKQSQSDSDLVSVVQFENGSRVTVSQQPLSAAPGSLSYKGGGTRFYPAAAAACNLARATPSSHTPAIIFMSDGQADDASSAAHEFAALNSQVYSQSSNHLELHVIAFGSGTNQAQLQQIASASSVGKVHASSNTAELAGVFVDIASNQNVSLLLESEIAKRISEAVSDKLSMEYFG